MHPPDPYNPYAAPSSTQVVVTDAPPDRPRGAVLTAVFAGGLTIEALGCLVVGALGDDDLLGMLGHFVLASLMVARPLVGLAWLHEAWRTIPEQARRTYGGGVSPGGLVFRMFIPFYNVYWLFRGSTLLCDTLNAHLAWEYVGVRVPRILAVLAATGYLVCRFLMVTGSLTALGVAGVVDGALWLAFMVHVDRAQREMLDAARPVTGSARI